MDNKLNLDEKTIITILNQYDGIVASRYEVEETIDFKKGDVLRIGQNYECGKVLDVHKYADGTHLVKFKILCSIKLDRHILKGGVTYETN